VFQTGAKTSTQALEFQLVDYHLAKLSIQLSQDLVCENAKTEEK